jgi:hypothetical protein
MHTIKHNFRLHLSFDYGKSINFEAYHFTEQQLQAIIFNTQSKF